MARLGGLLVLAAEEAERKNSVFVCLYLCGRNGHYVHTDVNTVTTLFVYASHGVWCLNSIGDRRGASCISLERK